MSWVGLCLVQYFNPNPKQHQLLKTLGLIIPYPKLKNILQLGCKYPRNVSKIFQRDISSRSGDIPIILKFQWGSKPYNKLTDIQ